MPHRNQVKHDTRVKMLNGLNLSHTLDMLSVLDLSHLPHMLGMLGIVDMLDL